MREKKEKKINNINEEMEINVLKKQKDGEKVDEDIYTEKGREEEVENDEISDKEEAFVEGYEEDEEKTETE